MQKLFDSPRQPQTIQATKRKPCLDKPGERGVAMIELCLCMSLLWLPLFLGTWEIGFNLIREIQVTQICRDAGHMFSQGTDFSLPMYQNLLSSLMPGTFTPTSSGNTVVYLESIIYVDQKACGNTSNCNNLGKMVFTRAVPVGNSGLRKPDFGDPLSCMSVPSGSEAPMTQSNGYQIPSSIYLTNSCAVVSNFNGLISLTASTQIAFLSEMYVQSSDLDVWSYLGSSGTYARSIF